MTLLHFQLLSALLFCVGLYGVLARRSSVLVLMAIELMLNAVNVYVIAVASYGKASVATGQVIAIFVITIVMGDFLTIGVMGGQQIPSVGKIINVEMTYLQFPAAAANAVILIVITLMIIFAMTKLVDIRKEL